ncbi:MAG: hypothetical protein MUF15_16885 [Acidobacteria bacterium]|nr:hypothetical protein [Acidobacteriota bacterium]
MSETLSLIPYQMVSPPGMLSKATVFPSLKKTINKNPRESIIPIFNSKPGQYLFITRHSGSAFPGVKCRLINKSKKLKKRR